MAPVVSARSASLTVVGFAERGVAYGDTPKLVFQVLGRRWLVG
jgi:hypothetical protein